MLDPQNILRRFARLAEARGCTAGTLCQEAGVGYGYPARLAEGAVTIRTMRRASEWLDAHDLAPPPSHAQRDPSVKPQHVEAD